MARVRDDRPDDVLPDALVWGDARLGNMLFVDGEPSALLDFEFCHVGLREFDVAFFSLFDEILAVHFMRTERLSGYPGHDESLDLYEAVSGNPIRHRSYFTLMACTYSALATTRVLQGPRRSRVRGSVTRAPARADGGPRRTARGIDLGGMRSRRAASHWPGAASCPIVSARVTLAPGAGRPASRGRVSPCRQIRSMSSS